MAQKSYFFDSVDHDRIYSTADFARVFGAIAGRDGVIYGYGNELAVNPGSGLAVTVGTGAAFVQGRMLEVYSAAETLSITTAHATNPRIDRVVVRVDLSSSERRAYLAVKTGTPAATPSAPLLQQDATVWEMSLAQVRVAAGATGIVAGDITDERGMTSLSDGATAATTLYTPGVAGFDAATVQAGLDVLAGSRVVEIGTNDFGGYTKWENGQAVVYGRKGLEGVTTDPNHFAVYFPITLKSALRPGVSAQYSVETFALLSTPNIRNIQLVAAGSYFNVFVDQSNYTYPANSYLVFNALGRWK